MKHWHTYNKNTAKAKSVVPFLLFTLLLLLSSCNLFIEEEEIADGYGYTNLPEYSGEGYDEPVTTTQGDCEVTYQLKKTVRQLGEENTRYITSVKQDNSGLLLEIHYSAQTPSDQLPQRGQVLVCTDTETFPMGCMHRVQTAEQRDGEYCYLASLADLQETFDELDITGQMVTAEDETVYIEPEPAEDSDEPATSRSNRAIALGSTLGFDLVDGGFRYTYTFDNKPFAKFSTPELERADIDIYFNEGSVHKVTHTFNFDDFSFSRRSFKITYEKEEEYDLSLHIGTEFNGNKNLAKFQLVKGKAFIIGPVVLVLFANLDLDFEASVKFSGDIMRHSITRSTYNIDLLHPLDVQKTEKVITDTGWYSKAMLSGQMGLRATLELCIGLYGKILSLRLCPSVYFGLEASIAKPIDREGGIPVYDVSMKPGVTPKCEFQMEMGVYFELSFLDFFKELFEKITSSNIDTALDRLADEANENSDWYKEHSAKDQWTDKDLERFRRKDGDNSSITHTFGPWNIVKFPTTPWYPSIVDNSFRIDNYYDELTHQMNFDASFTIEDIGVFGRFQNYSPALMIMRNGKQVDFILPDGEDRNATIEKGKTYYFTLPEYGDDVTRVARPCYYKTSDATHECEALEKGLPFCATTPSLSIVEVRPERAEIKEGNFVVSIWNEETEEYDYYTYPYQYNYFFDVVVSVRGAEYMRSWGLFDLLYYQEFNYGTGMNKDIDNPDGTYTFHCIISTPSNYYDSKRSIDMSVSPRFQLKTGEVIYPEEPTRWTQYADGTYKKK